MSRTLEGSIDIVLAALRAERASLAARVDAIDLALENLARALSLEAATPASSRNGRRKSAARRNGKSNTVTDSAAAQRRELLLKAITKSPAGLTLPELRKRAPKIAGRDRSNALQVLRAAGAIERKGNAWVAIASRES